MENKLKTVDAEILLSTPMSKTMFIVDNLIPQGVNVISGASKIGKSWLMLWLGLQVAQGLPVWGLTTQQCDVLYLSLEDTQRRIKDRLYNLTDTAPSNLFFAALPGMWERTVSCSSLSKTYSITGWRLGYIIAPPNIIEVAKKVHDFLTVGAAAPLQEAAVTGLRFVDGYYDDLREKYTAKRDLFIKGLDDIGIKHTVPQGAYYVMLDISEFGFESDLEFCDALARDVGVGAVPGSSFFREPVNNLIRLHFAKKDETLYAALNRLSDIRKKIPK